MKTYVHKILPLKIFTTDLFMIGKRPGNSEMPLKRRMDKPCYIYTMVTIQQERSYIHIDESQKYASKRHKSHWTQNKCIANDPNYMKF